MRTSFKHAKEVVTVHHCGEPWHFNCLRVTENSHGLQPVSVFIVFNTAMHAATALHIQLVKLDQSSTLGYCPHVLNQKGFHFAKPATNRPDSSKQLQQLERHAVTASLTVSPVDMRSAWRTSLLLLALSLPAALLAEGIQSFESAEAPARRSVLARWQAAARHPQHHAKKLLQQANALALTHFGGIDMEGEPSCEAVLLFSCTA
jgi:hypothetical protein